MDSKYRCNHRQVNLGSQKPTDIPGKSGRPGVGWRKKKVTETPPTPATLVTTKRADEDYARSIRVLKLPTRLQDYELYSLTLPTPERHLGQDQPYKKKISTSNHRLTKSEPELTSRSQKMAKWERANQSTVAAARRSCNPVPHVK